MTLRCICIPTYILYSSFLLNTGHWKDSCNCGIHYIKLQYLLATKSGVPYIFAYLWTGSLAKINLSFFWKICKIFIIGDKFEESSYNLFLILTVTVRVQSKGFWRTYLTSKGLFKRNITENWLASGSTSALWLLEELPR